MATTYIPININNGFQSATSINANFLDIQQDLDRKLSRFGDENAQLGDLDNAMQTVFDMNDNRGLNCPYPEDKPEWNYDLVPKIYIDQLINQLIDWDKVGIATTTIFGISLLATDQDAIDGIDDSKNLTPSNLPPVLNAKVPDILIDQIINNPQIINEILAVFPQATETIQGKIEIATQAETNAGLDDERAVTPLKLATYIGGVLPPAVPDATETVKGKTEIATQLEVNAGLDDFRYVTPLKLANLLASVIGITDASYTNPGYVEFENKFVIQWGYNAAVPGDTLLTVNLPLALTGTHHAAVCTYYWGGIEALDNTQTGNLTLTTLDVRNGNVSNWDIRWISLGSMA